MEIKLIDKPIPLSDVAAMAEAQFGEMIKATVDVERKMLALGGDLHSDEEALLLEGERVEFDSMINVRPSQNNRSRGVEDPKIRERILGIVKSLISS